MTFFFFFSVFIFRLLSLVSDCTQELSPPKLVCCADFPHRLDILGSLAKHTARRLVGISDVTPFLCENARAVFMNRCRCEMIFRPGIKAVVQWLINLYVFDKLLYCKMILKFVFFFFVNCCQMFMSVSTCLHLIFSLWGAGTLVWTDVWGLGNILFPFFMQKERMGCVWICLCNERNTSWNEASTSINSLSV